MVLLKKKLFLIINKNFTIFNAIDCFYYYFKFAYYYILYLKYISKNYFIVINFQFSLLY